MAGFMLIPNMTAYWLLNRDYPRDDLGLLYLDGGAITFFTQRLAGQLTETHRADLYRIYNVLQDKLQNQSQIMNSRKGTGEGFDPFSPLAP